MKSEDDLHKAKRPPPGYSICEMRRRYCAPPSAHHKKLVDGAHALHRAQLIDRDDLADLLEQTDGALAYTVEALLDEANEQ